LRAFFLPFRARAKEKSQRQEVEKMILCPSPRMFVLNYF